MGCKNVVSFLGLLVGRCLRRRGFRVTGRCLVGVMVLVCTSCGGNMFEGMSGKTSHDAIVEEVKNLVNDQQFAEAVALIEGSSGFVVTDRGEKLLMASAYAGACGLTFADVFDSLSTASGSPMKFMMSAFTNRVLDPTKCFAAQQWIERIGNAGTRTVNENIAMFLVGFAKVGAFLRYRADTSATGIGDGTVDATFDSCDNTKLPRSDVKQVVTGFGLMIENVAALGTMISGSLSGNITSIGALCTGLGLSCNVTNPSGISDADADDFRDAIKSDDTTQIGIEDCDPLDMTCC